jgi:flagellar protein FlbD
MIMLTRLSGTTFLLNADLIERVDSTPDTVVTLVDGKKYVVCESMSDVLDSVVAFRGEIVALGTLLDAVHPFVHSRRSEEQPRLAAVTMFPKSRDGLDALGDHRASLAGDA